MVKMISPALVYEDVKYTFPSVISFICNSLLGYDTETKPLPLMDIPLPAPLGGGKALPAGQNESGY